MRHDTKISPIIDTVIRYVDMVRHTVRQHHYGTVGMPPYVTTKKMSYFFMSRRCYGVCNETFWYFMYFVFCGLLLTPSTIPCMIDRRPDYVCEFICGVKVLRWFNAG